MYDERKKYLQKNTECMLLFKGTNNKKFLNKLTGSMAAGSMETIDKEIIGDIFHFVRLEQEMPKFTEKKELEKYLAPTLVIAGSDDIFFPNKTIEQIAKDIIPNLTLYKTYNMGHFPSKENRKEINEEIEKFLENNYK